MFFGSNKGKNNKTADTLTIVAIIVALIAMGAYFRFAPRAEELGYRPIEVTGSSITVEDQEAMDVVVLGAVLMEPGFITIHESLSGAPAAVVGTSEYMETGIYANYQIDLETEMRPGYRYIALLHIDNGDSVFVMNDDLPVMSDNVVVRPDFIAGEVEETEE